MIWNSKQFSSLVKRLLQAFLDSPNWIYKKIYIYIKKHIKSIARALNMFYVSLAVIFLTAVEYGTSSRWINSSKLFMWVFSHLICGWLVELHVEDKALSVKTMMIIYNNFKWQNVIQLNENQRLNTAYLTGIGWPVKNIHYAI